MCVEKNVFEFNESGLLPKGCHEITLEEIKKYFVDNFPESTTRQSRFDCFMRFYKDLLKNVKSCIRLLIDGSFVENKVNPNDIDFVIVIDATKYNDYERFYIENEFNFKNLLRDEFNQLKEQENHDLMYDSDFFNYGCDFFPLVKFDKNSEEYSDYKYLKGYWEKQWGHNRGNIEKGFLNINVNYEDDFDGI